MDSLEAAQSRPNEFGMAHNPAHRLRALIVVLGLAGWAMVGTPTLTDEVRTAGQEEARFTTLNSAQLAAMLQSKNFFFVNVHIPYEGEIRDTDAIIPFDQITDNLEKLPSDKGARIVLYCRSGRMSEIAAGELASIGYTQVSHLAGGMIDWKESGHEIIEK